MLIETTNPEHADEATGVSLTADYTEEVSCTQQPGLEQTSALSTPSETTMSSNNGQEKGPSVMPFHCAFCTQDDYFAETYKQTTKTVRTRSMSLP